MKGFKTIATFCRFHEFTYGFLGYKSVTSSLGSARQGFIYIQDSVAQPDRV